MITGMVLGGAFLTKSPAQFFAVLLPGAILLFPPPRGSVSAHPRGVFTAFFKLLGLGLIIYFFAFGIYNILRLGPNFQMIASRNQDYVFPLNRILTNPFDPFQFHLKEIWQWFGTLLTWPIFLVSVFGMLVGLKKYSRGAILLLIWLFVPLFAQAEYAKVFTARYIFSSVPIILTFAAIGLFTVYEFLSRKFAIGTVALIVFFIWALKFDYQLLTNPQAAPLPRREKSGYLEEWTSGYGIREVANYLKERSKSRKILVGTEGYFGTLPDGLQIYLEKIPNVTIIGVGYPITKIPEALENSLKDNTVYLVVNDSRMQYNNPQKLKLIGKYPKAQGPSGQENLLFYEMFP
jgi:hypothetical protein